ncbi:hypothetical protein BD560DRAFT_128299 [Blakeslea trispora]|nr:hypothetical protein BD560DRAFT_128299 [Blakeslea trispora]
MNRQDNYIRAIAGLTLKNNLLNNFSSTPLWVLNYVKSVCLQSFQSPDFDNTIRRTIGSVITAIIVQGQIDQWPEVTQMLISILRARSIHSTTEVNSCVYIYTYKAKLSWMSCCLIFALSTK